MLPVIPVCVSRFVHTHCVLLTYVSPAWLNSAEAELASRPDRAHTLQLAADLRRQRLIVQSGLPQVKSADEGQQHPAACKCSTTLLYVPLQSKNPILMFFFPLFAALVENKNGQIVSLMFFWVFHHLIP